MPSDVPVLAAGKQYYYNWHLGISIGPVDICTGEIRWACCNPAPGLAIETNCQDSMAPTFNKLYNLHVCCI